MLSVGGCQGRETNSGGTFTTILAKENPEVGQSRLTTVGDVAVTLKDTRDSFLDDAKKHI